jgi:hypothetical protein
MSDGFAVSEEDQATIDAITRKQPAVNADAAAVPEPARG